MLLCVVHQLMPASCVRTQVETSHAAIRVRLRQTGTVILKNSPPLRRRSICKSAVTSAHLRVPATVSAFPGTATRLLVCGRSYRDTPSTDRKVGYTDQTSSALCTGRNRAELEPLSES